MSVYNETELELNKSIDSVLRQDFEKFELIIVDDNPNDIKIKEFLIEKSKEDKRIVVIFNSFNLGQAESRNIAVRMYNYNIIAVMDADDISNKERLSKQLNFMKENGLDFVYSNFKEIDKDDNIINDYKWKLKSTYDQKYLKYIFLNCSNVSLQSTWLLKKEVYDDLDGYRNIVVEDFDFNLRSLLVGYKQGYLSDCLVLKRNRSNGIMQSNRLKIYLTVKLLKKYVKREDDIPELKYISDNLIYMFDKKDEKIFNEFIIAYKKMINNFSYNNFKKFVLILLKCKFAYIYLYDSFILRIKQRIHKI